MGLDMKICATVDVVYRLGSMCFRAEYTTPEQLFQLQLQRLRIGR